MHELSMVVSVIDIVEQVAKENNLTHIQKICIKRGEFCGVLEDTFCYVFEHFRGNMLKDTRLEFRSAESYDDAYDFVVESIQGN